MQKHTEGDRVPGVNYAVYRARLLMRPEKEAEAEAKYFL